MTTRYYLTNVASDLGGGADFSNKLDPAAGLGASLAVTIAASATETSYGFTEPLVPGRRGSVGLQEYIHTVNVLASANMELKLRLRRISASGVIQASSTQTLAQSLNSTGIKSFEIYAELGAFESDERLRVDYEFRDLSGGGTTVTIEANVGDSFLKVPWDAGLLRPAMKRALESAYVVGTWLVEMDLPSPNVGGSPTTVRGSLTGTAAAGIGGYLPKVTSISRIPMGIAFTTSGAESQEVTVEWEDTDFEIAAIMEGPNGDSVIGSALRIRCAVQGLPEADWHTRFAGVIRAREHASESLTWRIRAGSDDRRLTVGEIPRVRVTASDFPNAPDDFEDVAAPLIFGVWDSAGVSNQGAVPTIYVDTVNHRYLVCHGNIFEITRVYKDGVLLLGSAWTRVTLTVNGKQFTLIDFPSDQGASIITADVKGFASLAGVPFERPIEILYTLFENFILADGSAGITSAFIPALMNNIEIADVRDFYEDDFDLLAAKHLADVRKPDSYLADFLSTWNYRAYWGHDGRLVIKPFDHRATAIYLDDPWVRGSEDANGLKLVYEDKDEVDRILVNFLQDAVLGRTVESLEVREPAEDTNIAESFDMTWGAAKVI